MEEGVSQALRGGDDGLRALYGAVDGVQHGGDGPLLRQGWEEDGEGALPSKLALDSRNPDVDSEMSLGRRAKGLPKVSVLLFAQDINRRLNDNHWL